MTEAWRLDGPATGPGAWTADELAQDQSWLHELALEEADEIDHALAHALATGKEVADLTREDFPLQRAAARLAQIVEEVENGRGLALLRGIRLADYSRHEARVLFWGVGRYIGETLVQNPEGKLLHTIEDIGNDYHGNNVRGHSTNARLRPHVDPSDIVGLFCIHPAKQGGLSTVSSALTIYNEILEHHPEYLDPLYRGFRIDYAGKGPTDAPDLTSPWRIPVFSYFGGRLTAYYNAKQFERGAEKTTDGLSELERAAILHVEELALRPDIRFDMGFRTGDIQFLNNYMIFHARTEYEDWDDAERKRLLLRQWWNVPEGRPLLPEVADRLGSGPRGGVTPYAAEKLTA